MESTQYIRWIWWGVIVIFVVVIFSLWQLFGLKECCENLETTSAKTAACCDELRRKIGGFEPPTPGPIISVGPSGTPSATSWMIGDPPSAAVVFGTSGYLRDDEGGRWKMLEARYGSTKVALTKLTIELKSGKKVVIEKDSSTPPKLIWTLDGVELLPCDFDVTNTRKDCTYDGVPPEFNGEISSFATVPSVTDSGLRVYAQGSN